MIKFKSKFLKMAEANEVDELVTPAASCHSRSVVWNYFEKTNRDTQAKCQLCKDLIKHSSNTSNMIKVMCELLKDGLFIYLYIKRIV